MTNSKKNSPGDGFEPPLKEPESFVLPLDDPGLNTPCYIILAFENLFTSLLLKYFCSILLSSRKGEFVC